MYVSNYNIYIPIPDKKQYLLIHGYRGTVDFIDENLGQNLKRWSEEKKEIDEIHIDKSLTKYLEERGYLTERTSEEEINFVVQLSKALHRSRFHLRGVF